MPELGAGAEGGLAYEECEQGRDKEDGGGGVAPGQVGQVGGLFGVGIARIDGAGAADQRAEEFPGGGVKADGGVLDGDRSGRVGVRADSSAGDW